MVSIHAPARGATHQLKFHLVLLIVSIHAPARGATFLHVLSSFFAMFQSTLPQGERLAFIEDESTKEPVSIHAPARGATYQ